MISLSDFSSIINPKWPVIAAFISFSGTWYGQKTFDSFSEWKPRFQSFSVVILTRSETYRPNKTTQNYSHLREESHHLLLINIFGSLSPVSSINSFPPNGILGYLLGKKMALVITHLVTYNGWLRGVIVGKRRGGVRFKCRVLLLCEYKVLYLSQVLT